MLSLQLKSGDYLTIGDDIAVQIFQQSGSAFSVAVKAPREIPILRGEVLEREGEGRPDGLRSHRPQRPSKRVRNAKNADSGPHGDGGGPGVFAGGDQGPAGAAGADRAGETP